MLSLRCLSNTNQRCRVSLKNSRHNPLTVPGTLWLECCIHAGSSKVWEETVGKDQIRERLAHEVEFFPTGMRSAENST